MVSTTDADMKEAVRKIMYRFAPPDGVWFDTKLEDDLEEILWKLLDNVDS
jgi:hypothetical protein